ncbi:hypothetical protein ACH5RR_014931 [Cinchona calisaya]|uniref:F-box associated beta-propeller type 3 domain-containing protein n=1 Tax=Cinchona calisaya TaxID=153742 RepID=A0ABD2ZUE4_9GENT
MYRIRNPATRRMLDLPDPHNKILKCAKMFYMTETDNYKLVISIATKEQEGGCEVLTVGTDLSWRTLDIPCFYNLKMKKDQLYSVAIDDIYFLISTCESKIRDFRELLCLEMGNESFETRKSPQAFFSDWKKCSTY